VVAFAVAVIVGRGIRMADSEVAAAPAVAIPRVRRRAIPLPPLGIGLAAVAVALETAGYVTRLVGSTGSGARLLSMDAPFSLPRMFVAFLFAVAALAAVAGAGSMPGRRAWWVAVGFVGGTVAAVKAGSTVHAEALSALSDAIGTSSAVGVSVALAAVVVGALWFRCRAERRDRRRVLGVLSLYAVAAVGLSALSPIVGQTYGATWGAAATYVEESGEALAAVAFVMAVLAGVAPRLVLPAAWPLRRTADAHTLDLPEQVPGRSVVRGLPRR
jgi:hypothetical protein